MHSYLPLRNTVKYIQMLFQANVHFARVQAAFLNKCFSEFQRRVPSSVHRDLTIVFCEAILITSLLTFQRLILKKKSWSYKIYVHKGTAILLKLAMLQYKRVQSVPFMQQSSLTNLNPLPVELTAQGLYPSLSVKRITSYYLINSKFLQELERNIQNALFFCLNLLDCQGYFS